MYLRNSRVMQNGNEAFLGLPLMSQSTPRSLIPFHGVRTPRRSRYVHTPCARSLDSYREGMRFRNSSPQDSWTKKSSEPKQKKRISLVRAMVHMKVASHETCELMVRKGFVRVNGKMVKSEKARIDRYTDRISVNGNDFGTMEQQGYDPDVAADIEGDKGFLPRTQRDFKRNVLDGEGEHKRFSRRVDQGFFAKKKYHFGK